MASVAPEVGVGRATGKRSGTRSSDRLHLDPKEGEIFPEDICVRVRDIILERSSIRKVTVVSLPRGGIAIHATKSSLASIESLLRSDLDVFKPARKRWLDKSSRFTLLVKQVSRSLHVTAFEDIPDVVEARALPHNRVLLFVDSLEAARRLEREGVTVGRECYAVFPFTSRPRVACPSCGSMDHVRCEVVKCFKCGLEGHRSGECTTVVENFSRVCIRCGQEGHDAAKCTSFNEKTKRAYDRKKKTYADALRGSTTRRKESQLADVEFLRQLPTVRALLSYAQTQGVCDLDTLFDAFQELARAQVAQSAESVAPTMGNSEDEVSREHNDEEKKVHSDVAVEKSNASGPEEGAGSGSDESGDAMDEDVDRSDEDGEHRPKRVRSSIPLADVSCSCGIPYLSCKKKFGSSDPQHVIHCPCGFDGDGKKKFRTHANKCSSVQIPLTQ